MLVLLSFDLARFCFKTSLIDRSGFFEIFEFFFDLAAFLFCIASGAKLSFASV